MSEARAVIMVIWMAFILGAIPAFVGGEPLLQIAVFGVGAMVLERLSRKIWRDAKAEADANS